MPGCSAVSTAPEGSWANKYFEPLVLTRHFNDRAANALQASPRWDAGISLRDNLSAALAYAAFEAAFSRHLHEHPVSDLHEQPDLSRC